MLASFIVHIGLAVGELTVFFPRILASNQSLYSKFEVWQFEGFNKECGEQMLR